MSKKMILKSDLKEGRERRVEPLAFMEDRR